MPNINFPSFNTSANTTYPVANPTYPVANPTYPVANPTYPVDNPTYPVDNYTNPVDGSNIFTNPNNYSMAVSDEVRGQLAELQATREYTAYLEQYKNDLAQIKVEKKGKKEYNTDDALEQKMRREHYFGAINAGGSSDWDYNYTTGRYE